MMGTVFIKDTVLKYHIGITEQERAQRQPVIVNIECDIDIAAAVNSDDIADTFDYAGLHRWLHEHVAGSGYKLLESLADAIARHCLEDARVQRVSVTLEKPNIVPATAACGLALELRR